MYAQKRQDKTQASAACGAHRLVSSGAEGRVNAGSVSDRPPGTSQIIHICLAHCKPFARKKEGEIAKKMKIVKNATKEKKNFSKKTQQEKNGKELDFVVFRLFAQKKVNLSSNLPKRKEPLARNTKKLYNYFVISLASLNTLEGEV